MTIEALLKDAIKYQRDFDRRTVYAIRDSLNLEALIGAEGCQIITERVDDKPDKHDGAGKPELGRVIGKNKDQVLYEACIETHGWFPDGSKLLMTYGTREKMLHKYSNDVSFKEYLFTLDMEGNIDLIDGKCTRIMNTAISPDGGTLAYINDSFNEGVHTYSKLHIRHLGSKIFIPGRIDDLRRNTKHYCDKILPGQSRFSLAWSRDSRSLGIIQQPQYTNTKNLLHLLVIDKHYDRYATASTAVGFLDKDSFLMLEDKDLYLYKIKERKRTKIRSDVHAADISVSPDQRSVALHDREGMSLKMVDTRGQIFFQMDKVPDYRFMGDSNPWMICLADGSMEIYRFDIYSGKKERLNHGIPLSYDMKDKIYYPRLFPQPEVKR